MSAFVVSAAHVSLLVQAATEPGHHEGPMRWYRPGTDRVVAGELLPGDFAAEDAAVRMLWLENVASVRYRYPDEPLADLPGVIAEMSAHATWGWLPAYSDTYKRGHIPPVVALKALACYEYQSCEHPGWESSAAALFCDTLRRRLIGRLSGWDAAPWSWESESEPERPMVAAGGQS